MTGISVFYWDIYKGHTHTLGFNVSWVSMFLCYIMIIMYKPYCVPYYPLTYDLISCFSQIYIVSITWSLPEPHTHTQTSNLATNEIILLLLFNHPSPLV